MSRSGNSRFSLPCMRNGVPVLIMQLPPLLRHWMNLQIVLVMNSVFLRFILFRSVWYSSQHENVPYFCPFAGSSRPTIPPRSWGSFVLRWTGTLSTRIYRQKQQRHPFGRKLVIKFLDDPPEEHQNTSYQELKFQLWKAFLLANYCTDLVKLALFFAAISVSVVLIFRTTES